MRDIFYFVCRLARKFLPVANLPEPLRLRSLGLQPNLGETNAAGILDIYRRNMPIECGIWLTGKDVLEIGVGRTNGSCYETLAAGARSATAFEPFRPLDVGRDRLQRSVLSGSEVTVGDVLRVASLDRLNSSAYDTALSLAVLEHVVDMDKLVADLWRVLKPGGCMLHIVDYRDHFFRYPYNHLLWSEKTWSRWLDPGDLPRWRVGDHVRVFKDRGFEIEVVKSSSLEGEYSKVQSRIHPHFAGRDDFDLRTTSAVLFGRKPWSN